MRLESATGEIALLTDTSSVYSQEKKSGSNVVWQSTRDKGNADQSVEHTEITATGDIQVIAAQGIRVEYRDTGNVDDSITQQQHQRGLPGLRRRRAYRRGGQGRRGRSRGGGQHGQRHTGCQTGCSKQRKHLGRTDDELQPVPEQQLWFRWAHLLLWFEGEPQGDHGAQ
nr:hypothetical protein [Humidesulfovibrio mexicanus]